LEDSPFLEEVCFSPFGRLPLWRKFAFDSYLSPFGIKSPKKGLAKQYSSKGKVSSLGS
jgi:hypothetical protein